MKTGLALGGCLFVLVLAGCGGGDAKPLTEDQFCSEWAKRECSKLADRCAITQASCEPVRKTVCQKFASDAHTSSAARQYQAGNTSACLERVNSVYGNEKVTKETWAQLLETCNRVFQGSAKINEKCVVDYDCEKKLICDKGYCAEKEVRSKDANCTQSGFFCPEGQYCKKMDAAIYVCSARQVETKTCSATEPCLETLRCEAGTCKADLDTGAACSVDDDCKDGLYCGPYVGVCIAGVTFALGSNSCKAFSTGMSGGGTTPDAGAPAADTGAPAADTGAPAADTGTAAD